MNGRLLHLLSRVQAGAPMTPHAALTLVQGLGIAGEAHADAASARQLLLVRQEDLDAFGLPAGSLRENLCLSGIAEADFVPGKVLESGGAALRLTFRCEPCSEIARWVPRLADIAGRRGILAVVHRGGVLRAGQAVTVARGALPAFSDVPGVRVAAIVARIPAGSVLDNGTLLRVAGLRAAYFRAIPAYLRSCARAGLPVHRVVSLRGETAPGVRALLQAEGVAFEGARVARAARWTPAIGPLLDSL